jgi:predicted ArsR family transcriptional regulator
LTKPIGQITISSVSTSFTSALGASREEIVNLLRTRGGVSADDLAESLGVSKQCVRKHLDVLERDGYVEHASERRERGRPANIYRLTRKAEELFPKRYDIFARAVLQQIGAVWGERGLNTVFCGCANDTIVRLRPSLEGLNFETRVAKLAELLKEEGFEAEAEQLSDGSFLLTEWNCPTAEVARDYRQICERELEVYRELLGTQVFRESRIVGGASRCVYRVLKPERTVASD